MDEPLAAALKFGFLAVLYLFLLWVARSASRDLARAADPGAVDGAGRGQPGPRGNPRLEVVAAMGHQPGLPREGALEIRLILNRAGEVVVNQRQGVERPATLRGQLPAGQQGDRRRVHPP